MDQVQVNVLAKVTNIDACIETVLQLGYSVITLFFPQEYKWPLSYLVLKTPSIILDTILQQHCFVIIDHCDVWKVKYSEIKVSARLQLEQEL